MVPMTAPVMPATRHVCFRPYNQDATPAFARKPTPQIKYVPDVHLVTLRPELEGLIVPSKFYGIAAAGRPTIFIGDEDGEIPLKKYECGFAIAQGDAAGLVRVLMKFAEDPTLLRTMGENARRVLDIEFDKAIAVARWDKALQEVLSL
jgi:glycosyltransferase involved in cell wall biosynthesis